MGTYRAVSDRGRAIFGEDTFDADFGAVEEQDHLVADLEIVPRPYKVLSDNYEAGKQGDTVELALPVEIEAALVSGGHLERIEPEPKPAKKKTAAKAAEQKE
jgi:hypothetical protein